MGMKYFHVKKEKNIKMLKIILKDIECANTLAWET